MLTGPQTALLFIAAGIALWLVIKYTSKPWGKDRRDEELNE